jgi:DNA mismatch endonuclease (patch repair protein)
MAGVEEYWAPKLARNVERDAASQVALKSLGWDVLTLWECELAKDAAAISKQLEQFLGPAGIAQSTGPAAS